MSQETTTKKTPNWSLIWTVASFVIGFAINGFANYMSNANKVDLLTEQVTRLANIVGEINKKIDARDEKYNDLDKRVTVIETELSLAQRKRK